MEIGWKRKTGPLRARGARAAFPSLGAASANAGRAAKRKNTMAPQRDWRVASATVAVVAAVFVALSLTPAPAAAQFPVPQKCTCWKPNGPYGTQQGRRVLPARARRRSVWSFLDMGAQFFATSCWWGALANTKKKFRRPVQVCWVLCYKQHNWRQHHQLSDGVGQVYCDQMRRNMSVVKLGYGPACARSP